MSAPAVGPGDAASVTVLVKVPPVVAFEVFTREIDLWWRTGPRFRAAGTRRGRLVFEPGPEGRVFETFERGGGEETFEMGRVTAWEPPHRLELEWRVVNFAPEEKTFVSVTFAPSPSGTQVTVRHSGWSALRADHPVRHGLVGAEFSRMMGLWWGDLLTALRERVDAREWN